MERWRDRKFRLLLYPDDITHAEAMKKLDEAGYKYAAILHEYDIWTDEDSDKGEHEAGSLKKPHWHVVVKFQNAIWSTALAKSLGIGENYVRDCKNLDGALLYLVHANNLDKYQYDLESVFGDLRVGLAKLLADDDEGSRVLTIVGMIDDSPGRCSYREILIKACNAGLYGEFRRLGAGVKYLIDEHNDDFAEFQLQSTAERFANTAEQFGEQVKRNKDMPFSHFVKRLDRMEKTGVYSPTLVDLNDERR